MCLENKKVNEKIFTQQSNDVNPFEPNLALDPDSIISGRGNTTILMEIIEDM